MYEDHGDTFAYEQDIYLEKKFTVKGDGQTLKINQLTEGLYTPNYEFYACNILGVNSQVRKIMVDGREVTDFYTDEKSALHFKCNKNFNEIQIFSL